MSHPTTLSRRAATAHALTVAALGDVDATGALDALVQLAVTRIGAQGGMISMLTDQHVSMCVQGPFRAGLPDGTEMPFEDSMCSHVLRTDDVVVIPDTRRDERVSSIAAVAAGDVGAYLGVPIRADEDLVGVLCVFDDAARVWTEREQADMRDLADHVAVELQRAASSAPTPDH